MESIIYSAVPINGVIEIPMLKECKCSIGLVSITLPYTGRDKVEQFYRDLEITCDQVDSTFLNPKRLLRKICTPYQFSKNKRSHVYTTHEFETILFFPIDSMERKLTIQINDQDGPITLASSGRLNPQKVTICLQVKPIRFQN